LEQKRFYLTRKKVVGFLGLCVWTLTFIFACLKSSLPVGNILAHTFGYLTYPLAIIMALISLATFLGFSYARNKKSTTYLILGVLFLALLIHSIDTFSGLEKVVDGVSLIAYLEGCYKSMSVFGAFGGVLAGSLSVLLGEMGAIIAFGILTTLFAGLFIDYHFYGKYEDSVKKLKGHKLREKVHKSDKERTASGSPLYSFSDKYESSDVIGEISISEEEANNSQNKSSYKNYTAEDVAYEISSNEENYDSNFNQNIESETGEKLSDAGYNSLFSSDDADKHRRDFMNATFGGYDLEQSTQSAGFSFENETENFSSYDNFSSQNSQAEDDISSILSSSEDDDLTSSDISSSSNFDFGSADKFNHTSYQDKNNFSTGDLAASSFASDLESSINQKNNNGFNFVQKQTTGIAKTPIQKSQPVTAAPNVQQSMLGVRYNPPPLSLLKTPKADKGDYSEEQARKSAQLENVLAAFNIPAKVQKIVRGPKITRFELSVPYGTSVRKIPQYEFDIAAALSAKAITIRAPIPGSQYVGIELENDTFTSVSQRELLESPEFQNAKDPLPVAIGKDISGEIVVKSLAKMVHLLIAGSTGSGKSVFIHNIILSLIYKLGPEDCRLVIIDPKKVELNCYDGLPHLLTPEVVKGSEKAINALKWCVKEMDRRYDLMSKSGYNNIEPYNKSELVKAGQFEKFPYIVIIVDELAEIMTMNKKEVELCIQRLTQLARACGMHLILATQRPSVDIISGVIKNNVPSRIAFSLQSGIDSKTILNTVGAEKLLGQGDMLFSPTGTSTMPRLQASYASNEEIKAVIDYDKKYNKAYFDQSIEAAINSEQMVEDTGAGGGFGGFEEPPQREGVDSYFKTAVKLVMANGGASVSYLQRRLSIGYARAARIVDQMEDKGYIAASTGAKLRKVLITPEQFAQDFGEDFNNYDE